VSDQQPDPDGAPNAATPEPDSGPDAGETGFFADTASSATPAQFGTGPFEQRELPTSVGKSGKRGGRGRFVWAVGLGLGYVVLAAGTAFGVIIDKSPTAVDVTAVNAQAYAAPAGVSGSAGASAKASAHATKSAKASASPTAAPTTAAPKPTPASTVTGSVSDGIHSGDLRFFLLPPPQGPSSVQGDPDGDTETIDEAVATYGGDSDQASQLQQAGFKTGADRTYQDSTMGANVEIQLIQFHSTDDAQVWAENFTLSGAGYAKISVPGLSDAKGWSYADDGSYNLVGLYDEGDTFFEVQIYSTQALSAQDLAQVLSAEHDRLAHG
jgi:hypothetical protein